MLRTPTISSLVSGGINYVEQYIENNKFDVGRLGLSAHSLWIGALQAATYVPPTVRFGVSMAFEPVNVLAAFGAAKADNMSNQAASIVAGGNLAGFGVGAALGFAIAGPAGAGIGGAVGAFAGEKLARWAVGHWGLPIVLDLDGDGIELIPPSSSQVYFDMDGDGFQERTGWAGADDGILVIDLGDDGAVTSDDEFTFGAYDPLSASDLAGLRAEFDTNGDGYLDARDARFDQFAVWRDANSDGISDPGEVISLNDLAIASLELTGQRNDVPGTDPNENRLLGTASFTRADGTQGTLADTAFSYSSIAMRQNADGTYDIRDGQAGTLIRLLLGSSVHTLDLGQNGLSGAVGSEESDTVVAGTALGVDISGLSGDDTLVGGDGNDTLNGGDGADVFEGGAGDDVIWIDHQDQAGAIHGDDGTDSVYVFDTGGVVLDVGAASVEKAFGGDGGDVFSTSGATAVMLSGLGGNDTLLGGAGDDVLLGGGGADVIHGGGGDDNIGIDRFDLQADIDGGDGIDTLLVEDAAGVTFDLGLAHFEKAVGGAGADRLSASGSVGVVIDGGDGDDVLSGSAGDDTLIGGAGHDTLIGGAGNDVLFADDQDMVIDGGVGNDTLVITGAGGVSFDLTAIGIENVIGGDGADHLVTSGTGPVTIDGGAGNDILEGSCGGDTLRGGAGADTLLGGAGDDTLVIDTEDGPAAFDGGAGYDTLVIGEALTRAIDVGGMSIESVLGADTTDIIENSSALGILIDGAGGDDTLSGGGGADTLFGGDGSDLLTGGAGDDLLRGGAGADVLRGGDGNDTLGIDSADQQAEIDGGDGYDVVIAEDDGGVSLDLGAASVEAAFGGAGRDVFYTSGNGAIVLEGNGGDDVLSGGAGDDKLSGGDGDDTLYGGGGNDILTGGAGTDVAVFAGRAQDYKLSVSQYVKDGQVVHAAVVNDLHSGSHVAVTDVEAIQFSDQTLNLTAQLQGIAVDDRIRVYRDTPTTFDANVLKLNDWDADYTFSAYDSFNEKYNRQMPAAFKVTSVGNAVGGTVIFNAATQQITFTPEAGFSGLASFTYELLTAGSTTTSQATVTVEVDPYKPTTLPADPLFPQQQFLYATGQNLSRPGTDLNILSVWEEYTGDGLIVSNIEGGIQYTHPDLISNYNSSIDYDYYQSDDEIFSMLGSHATSTTALLAAASNNIGGVGVAFEAEVFVSGKGAPNGGSPYTLFDEAIRHAWQNGASVANFIGSYAESYGYPAAIDAAALRAAAEEAARQGRGGLGMPIAMTGGNEYDIGYDANYFVPTNIRQFAMVAALDVDGNSASWSTPGASLLVSAPGKQLLTADVTGDAGYVAGDVYAFGGTCGATPLVTGVMALMIDANGSLGYRDVYEILAYSARQTGTETGEWAWNHADNWNGGGLHVSHRKGYGLIDAHAAVRLAETWTKTSTAANERVVSAASSHALGINDLATVTDGLVLPEGIDVDRVEVDLNIAHGWIGDLVVTLISPSGTESVLVNRPGKDPTDLSAVGSGSGSFVYTVGSTHHYGESSGGTWTLKVTDAHGNAVGVLNSWNLRAYGNTATADDTYIYTNEYIWLDVQDNAARRALSDGAGDDTINAAAISYDSVIDLTGATTGVLATRDFRIAEGTVIENAFTGDGNDVITGNQVDNWLRGGRGDDTLDGGAGADTLWGERGNDVLLGGLDADTLDGGDGLDILDGGAGADLLLGGGDADLLAGMAGDDVIQGGGGNDAASGGDGNDVVDGGDGGDILDGGAGEDTLSGGDGDDLLIGGLGGDLLQGGAGIDVVSYADSDQAVTIDLVAGMGIGGEAEGDRLSNVEGVIGSAFDDHIVGGAASEIFTGGGGSDILVGGGGWDRAVFDGLVSDYLISTDGDGVLVTSRVDGLTDTISGIETLSFDDAEVDLANGAVAAGDFAETQEDGSIRIAVAQLLANDYDLRDLAFTLQGVGDAENGTVQLDGDAVVFTAAPDFAGEASFTYQIANSLGGTATGRVRVQVNNVNDAPTTGADALVAVEDTTLVIDPASLLANDGDLDGDTLTVTEVSAAVGGTVSLAADGHILFVPTADYNGPAGFQYTVSDGKGGQAIGAASVTVSAVNDAPVAVLDQLQAVEDQRLFFEYSALLGNDRDAEGDAIRLIGTSDAYKWTDKVEGGTVQIYSNGITFTPDADFNGVARFTYMVADPSGARSTGTVEVDVAARNDAPVAAVDNFTLGTNSTLVLAPALLLANDHDIDGDTLTLSAVGNAVGGKVSLGVDGTVTFTPISGYSGPAQFAYWVRDPSGAYSSAIAKLSVSETLTVAEDQSLSISVEDLGANGLTLVDVTGAEGGSVRLENGHAVFTAAPDFNGTARFKYTLRTATGALVTSATAIAVKPVNDAPVTETDSFTSLLGRPVDIAPSTLLANDTDIEGNALVFAGLGSATGGSVFQLPDGRIRVSPSDGAQEVSFEYFVRDVVGATSTGIAKVTIRETNTSPVVTGEQAATLEDSTLHISAATLLGNDHDPDGDTIELVSVGNGVGGVAVLNSDGTIDFTPDADFNGIASFEYSVSDGVAAGTARVEITVSPVNDTPVAVEDALATAEDTPITIDSSALVGNDRDVDGDPLAVTWVGSAVGGSVAMDAAGRITFTPNANFNGTARFSYRIEDGHGGSSLGTASIAVAPVNDAPVANDATLRTSKGTTITGSLPVSDPDQPTNTLSFALIGQAANGAVTLQSDGTYVYSPAAGFTGQDSFVYTVTDAAGVQESGAITLNVVAVNSVLSRQVINVSSSRYFASPAIGAFNDGGFVVVWTKSLDSYGVQAYDVQGRPVGGQTFVPTSTISMWNLEVKVLPDNSYYVSYGNKAVRHAANGAILQAEFSWSGNGYRDDRMMTTLINGDTVTCFNKITSAGDHDIWARISGSRMLEFRVHEISEESQVSPAVVAMPDGGFYVFWRSDHNEGYTDLQRDVWGRRFAGDGTPIGAEFVVPGPRGTAQHRAYPDAVLLTDGRLAVAYQQNSQLAYVTIIGEQSASEGGSGDDVLTGTPNVDIMRGMGGNDTIYGLASDDTLDGGTGNDRLEGGAGNDTALYTGNWREYVRTVNADGSVTLTDRRGIDGTDTLLGVETFTFADRSFRLDQNNAPVAVADTATTLEDQVLRIPLSQLLANDGDFDGDTLSLSVLSTLGAGSAVIDGDTLVFTPSPNANGRTTITFAVADGHGGTATSTLNIDVQAVNDLPVAVSEHATISEDGSVTTTPVVSDVDDTVLSPVIVSGPEAGRLRANGDGTWSFLTDGAFDAMKAGETRDVVIGWKVIDAKGGESAVAAATITVTGVNDAPVGIDGDVSLIEGDPATTITLVAADADQTGALTYAILSRPAQGALVDNGDGTVSFQPGMAFEDLAKGESRTVSFTWKAVDEFGADTGVRTTSITVTGTNDGPVAQAETYQVTSGSLAVDAAAGVLNNDTDVDGDTLSAVAATIATERGGTVDLRADGSFVYTARAGFSGKDRFAYTLSDGALTSTAKVELDVKASANAPTARDDSYATLEDTAMAVSAAAGVLRNDSDPDGDPLRVVNWDAASGQGGTVTIRADGSIVYRPKDGFNGSDTFTYEVDDGHGAVVSATVHVDVLAVNDGPVADAESFVVAAGQVLIVTAADGVLANDSDPDGDALSVLDFDTRSAHGGQVVMLPDGSFSYDPAAGFSGTDTFGYVVSDGNGGVTLQTVTVEVAPGGSSPVANLDHYFVDEDGVLQVAGDTGLLANDSDPDGDALRVVSADQYSREGASISIGADGSFVYMPRADFFGEDSFNYAVTDGDGHVSTGVVTVTVAPVNEVNDASHQILTLSDDFKTVDEDAVLSVSASQGVIAGGTDTDGHAVSVSEYQALTDIGGVVVMGVDGSFTYTPPADYHGQDSFTYTVSNGTVSASARVSVTVNAINDDPVARDDAFVIAEDVPLVVSVAELLANDGDVDGDNLTIRSVGHAENGTVALDGNGNVVFTPAANYHGPASFEVRIDDGNGSVVSSTVRVDVTSVNDAPVPAATLSGATDEDAFAFAADLLAGTSDVDASDTLSATDLAQSGGRPVAFTQMGDTITLDPAQFTDLAVGESETLTFAYNVFDGTAKVAQTLTVTVEGRNDAPVLAAALSSATDEDLSVFVADLLAGVSDVDGSDVLSAVDLVQTGGRVVTFTQTGDSITLDPVQFNDLAVGESETLTFAYNVFDGTATVAQTLTVTVEGRNDAPVLAAALIGASDEDASAFTADLLAGASDVDASDELSATDLVQTGGRPVAFSQSGNTLALDPGQFNDLAVGESVTLTFGYSVFDGTAKVAQTLTLTVEGRNDAPVLSATLAGTTHDNAALFTTDLLAGAADADATDTLSAVDLVQTSGRAAAFTQNGNNFAFDPAQFDDLVVGQSETLTFAYNVWDGSAKVAQTLTITVEGRNDLPVLEASLSGGTHEDAAPFTANLLAGASDVDSSDTLSAVDLVQTGGRGVNFSQSGGTIVLDPAQFNDLGVGESEKLTFSYNVFDGAAKVAQTLTITIEGRNDLPVLTVIQPEETDADTEPFTADLLAGGSDADVSDILSVVDLIQTGGQSAEFTLTGSTFSLDPGQFSALSTGEREMLTFTYNVFDGTAKVLQTLSLTVIGTNDIPVIAAPLFAVANEDTAFTTDLLAGASDEDAADILSAVDFVQAGGRVVAFSQTGNTIALDPSQFNDLAVGESETLTFTYNVSDGKVKVAQTLTITVEGRNDLPVLEAVLSGGTHEDAALFIADLLAGVSDVDASDLLSVTDLVQTGGRAAAFSQIGNSFGLDPSQFTDLAVGESVTLTFGYSVFDGTAKVAQTLTLTVEGRNDLPVIGAALSGATDEDVAPFTADLLVGATDVDASDVLSATDLAQLSGRPVAFTQVGDSISVDPGQFTDLAVGESATLTFGYNVFDGTAKVAQTLTLMVEGRNDLPVLEAALSGGTSEDAAPFTADLLAGASDVDATDVLSAVDLVQTGGRSVSFTQTGNAFALDPAQFNDLAVSENETVTFAYNVFDGHAKVAQTLTLTVTGRNDLPVLEAALSSGTHEDAAPFTADLLAGATDIDATDVLSAVDLVQTSGRAVTFTQTGNAFALDPAQFNDLAVGESETVTFAYNVWDGTAKVRQTLTITIEGRNDLPVLEAALSDATNEDAALFTADLLAGASDVDASDTLSATDLVQLSGRPVAFTQLGDSISVDPVQFIDLAVGESATLTFGYNVFDGTAKVAQTLTLTIEGRNDLPVIAAALSGATDEDAAPFTADLLAGATDVDASDVLSAVDLIQTSGRTATFTQTGNAFALDSVQFNDLAAGESETLTFTYNVFDGHAKMPQTLTVTVEGRNDIPVLEAALSGGTHEDATPFTANLLAGASDVDASDTLLAVDLVQTGGRVVTFTQTGDSFALDPAQFDDLAVGESETLSFSYNVWDGHAKVPQTLTITVEGRNDVPVLEAALSGTTHEDSLPFTADLLAGASDVDATDILSATDLVQLSGRPVVFTQVGDSISVDPAQFTDLAVGESATLVFGYNVFDGHAKVPEALTLTVEGRNDGPVAMADYGGVVSAYGAIRIAIADLLANDSDVDASDTLSLVSIGNVVNGWAVLTGDGGILVQPHLGHSGEVSFDYTITDGHGGFATTTVRIDSVLPAGLLAGGDGNDRIDGSRADNLIDGRAGNDRLRGRDGNDTLVGGAGNDELRGEGGDDLFLFAGQGGGVDTIEGGRGYDRLLGGIGDDTISFRRFSAELDVEAIDGGLGRNLILGTDGEDDLDFSETAIANIVAIDAGADDDEVEGSQGGDIILGGSGDDELEGNGGDDVLDGGADDDELDGGDGADLLLGGDGNDDVYGGWGNDTLDGGSGNDVLNGAGGNDVLLGGDGQDQLVGGTGDDLLDGGEGNDRLWGNGGTDVLTGGGGDDTLWGGSGIDTLAGGAGDDRLYGGGGLDDLSGGAGNDRLVGGSGENVYRFGRGDGIDVVDNSDWRHDDRVVFGEGVSADQLWFSRDRSDLVIGVVGGTDHLVVDGWFNSASHRVAAFETADGHTLVEAQVQNLVNAMATMTPPPVGQTRLTAQQHQQLDTVIAANWQSH